MPAGSRPRKRTAAAAAATSPIADSPSIAPSACSTNLATTSATLQPASSHGSGSGSEAGSVPPSSTGQQQQPAGGSTVDHHAQDEVEPPKRKRGRPRKLVYYVSNTNILNETHADDEDREYEKLRKINHNVIERRRRDQINQSISELADMLPMSIHQGAALNKLNTLKLSVDFVRQLTAQNQELLVERQVMRNMLQERGVDWKLVEVAIAERRAQMSVEAEHQAQQDHQQGGLPRLLPSTNGGQVAIAANKAQAQQLQQQQATQAGRVPPMTTAPAAGGGEMGDKAVVNGAVATMEQQQQQHSAVRGANGGLLMPTASGFVSNEGRWLPSNSNVSGPGHGTEPVPVPVPVPLLPAQNVPSFSAHGSSALFGRVGNTPPSTPGASPAPSTMSAQHAAVGGGLVALASVACAMDASAPSSPACSTASVPVMGNTSLRLPPPPSSSLSLPFPSSSPIGASAQPFPHHSPFHPLNSSSGQQQVYSTPTSVTSTAHAQPMHLAPAASSYPTSTSSSAYSLPSASFASGQPVQYQRQQTQPVHYPSPPSAQGPLGSQPQPQQFAEPRSQSCQQQQPHQPQYFYYSAPHSRQVSCSVPASPMVGNGAWTTGPGFLN